MSLRLNRALLLLGVLLAGDAWALGLGEVRLNSALNEPLRAEIQLLSATPEELAELKVDLASAATFERYGIDRPHFLTRLRFTVDGSSRDGVVRISSEQPITEPFVTILVEASWASGRVLREYTVLLDPPTFAPPPAAGSSSAVTAPQREQPADSGRIERPAAPAAAVRQPAGDDSAASASSSGGDVRVQRGDTLWQIAARVRPDNRLSLNQVMLSIYEANPEAFAGNINRLTAGATLRIPAADDIYRINRGAALSEVQRHNADWAVADTGRAQPSLTLVPPDGDQPEYAAGAAAGGADRAADAGTAARISELEAMVEDQRSLLEVRDNELAQLREQLARLREQAGEPVAAADEAAPVPADEALDPADEVFAEDEAAEVAADEEAAPVTAAEPPAPTVVSAPPEPGLLDRIVGVLSGFWGILGIVLLLVVGVLLWLAKRASSGAGEDSTGVWETLDGDEEIDSESRASTERLRALARDDDSSIVVVEQDGSPGRRRADSEPQASGVEVDGSAETSEQPALADTFSGETGINLDQTDPVAEADFHMAYGLYDQAADLINGALAAEPERQDLMAKLCEIYFVWGNRDAFVDAASRLHDQLGGETTPDWDKIVIMGQQIAPDHRLFSGVSAAAATRAVDLSFDDGGDDAALDMDFNSGGQDGQVSDVIDLGGDEEKSADYSGLDFTFDDEESDTGASTTREMPGREAGDDATVENPTLESPVQDQTLESPTVEQPVESLESTSEMSTLADTGDTGGEDARRYAGDQTAEIDLDDLGLNLEALAESGLADMDDDSDSEGEPTHVEADLDETSENKALQPDLEATGKNLADDFPVDESAETGVLQSLNVGDEALDATSEMPAMDEPTGRNPSVPEPGEHQQTDVDFDSSLLDATGHTQVLGDDYDKDDVANDDDAETMLAQFDDYDGEQGDATEALDPGEVDFDFAGTEALSEDAFSGEADETAEAPAAKTDLDLDLDDLTAALRETDGDTVDQPRDEAALQQRKSTDSALDLDLGEFSDSDDDALTEALSPDDLSDDLHNARTMTEVGTKLDLARAYVDMGDPDGARSILEEVLDEGDEGQRQQAQRLIEALPV